MQSPIRIDCEEDSDDPEPSETSEQDVLEEDDRIGDNSLTWKKDNIFRPKTTFKNIYLINVKKLMYPICCFDVYVIKYMDILLTIWHFY